MLRKGCALIVVLLLVLVMAMFATCPKEVDHRLAVTELGNEVLQAKIEQSGVNRWLKAAGIDFGDKHQALLDTTGSISAGFMVNNLLHIDDYYFFSVGRLKVGAKDYVVSVGVLNHVFTPDKETVIEVIDNYLR